MARPVNNSFNCQEERFDPLSLGCFKEDGEIQSISREVRRVIKHDGVLFVVDITEDFPKIYSPDFSKGFRWFDT